ncbi:Futalosine hydrolase [Planctomycetes bacterium Poly30]|uniref:Futalosine hydrolase n=1 Tax=Saltatorellus ferox TaxID=2528018 RepID=A0A518EKP4_9BACT|nr:Futalosine hydrolase [Planctomycetes bacterium Poly30]
MLHDSQTTLLCVPTRFELDRLRVLAPEAVAPERWAGVAVIGFGPVAAAAAVSRLIAQRAPKHLILAGIAGTYGAASEAGSAITFGSVAMDGVGAGEGAAFVRPSTMGFPQWEGKLRDDESAVAAVFDRLDLESEGPELLTVAAAADGSAMLEARRARFPDAVAEDMEGFGVALAAAMGNVGVSIVRGFSNVAGNRDPKTWAIDDALGAVAEWLER